MKLDYLVIKENQVIGEFSQLEDAELFQYIVALHSNEGEEIHVAQTLNCMEVAE